MTIHQWIFLCAFGAIVLFVLWAFLAPLAEFGGTSVPKVFGAILLAVIFKLGPFALLIYGIWAFFIDGR